MVKGVSRRVVVIESPEPKIFEQAIFIVRNDAILGGVSEREIVDEAREVVRDYVGRETKSPRRARLRSPLFAAFLCAAAIALVWLLSTI